MPNYSLTRLETLFLQMESVAGTIPNATGTASLAGSNACRVLPGSMLDPDVALVVRQDKTGTRTLTPGVPGRKFGRWSASMSLAGNGAAGVVPDCDPILQCAFGQAATVSAGVSCTYNLSDSIPTMDVWSFRDPAGIQNRVALGSVCSDLSFDIGGDIATLAASGESMWVLGSDQFATADATQKGGLTTFPVKPATPVTNGNAVIGFTGSVTLDGNAYSTLRTAKVTLHTANVWVKDQFGLFYPSIPEGDSRNVTVDFSLYDDDSANLTALKNKANLKTGVTIVFVVGTIAGNIWTFTLHNVQLTYKTVEAGRRYAIDFTGTAYGTTLTAKDELVLALT